MRRARTSCRSCASRSSSTRSSIAARSRAAPANSTCRISSTGWLADADTREADLAAWIATIRPLCESISELLWITRENARPTEETAPGGSFQIVFERDQPVQLLRITVPAVVPAVSGDERQPSPLQPALPALEQRAQPAGAGERGRPVRCSRSATESGGARSSLPALRHAPRVGRQSRGGRSAASAASSSTSADGSTGARRFPASPPRSDADADADAPKH